MYLISFAKLLLERKTPIAGPRYFIYNGEWLNEIRHRLVVEELRRIYAKNISYPWR